MAREFWRNYLRSTRPYYGFVTGSATLLGVLMVRENNAHVPWWRVALALAFGFGSWGVNQIFNDATNLKEDRVNAPWRPMASGALEVRKAVLVSAALMALFGVVSVCLTPWTLVPVVVGVLLNLLYSYAKGVPLLGPLVYGLSIAMCSFYGMLCVNAEQVVGRGRGLLLWTWLALAIPHVLMCNNSYFKDVEGDRAARKFTLQVLLPRWLSLGVAVLLEVPWMLLLLATVRSAGWHVGLHDFHWGRLLESFLVCTIGWGIAAYLCMMLFFQLVRRNYHRATLLNAMLCVSQLFALCYYSCWPGLPMLGLQVASLVAMKLLYEWSEGPEEEGSRFVTGLAKLLFYARMSLVCAWRYRSPAVLRKAAKFTSVFFQHKLLRLPSGEYKLDFYMPRYPSAAFFAAMEDKLLRRPPRPVSVVLSISKACAYRCPHCYQGLDLAGETPVERLREVVRELREFGVVAWAVEGGEPMLRFERLEAVLEELRGLEVWVNSTGFGATPEKIRRLKELQVTGVMSSIHSVEAARHDAFTGHPGAHQTALEFLRGCREAGMLIGFNTVLTDEQVLSGGIDAIMALAQENRCDYIQLIHPKECGRWRHEVFDSARHAEAVRVACEAQRRYNSSREPHAPILTAQVFEESPQMLGCTAGGIDRFYIGCSGEVQPCEFVNLSFGNLNEEPFAVIYERMRSAFPVPCQEWCCREHAREIAQYSGETLPIPWAETEKLIAKWRPGTPTSIYETIGIYHDR